MNPAIAGAAMGGASAGVGLLGGSIQQGMSNRFQREEGKRSRRFNADEAQLDRDWQAQMRSTQYQTARDDMVAAGINPLLMAGGKAQHAGTPSGAQASSTPVSMVSQDPMGKAIGAAGAAASLRMATAQARHAEANAVMAEQGAYKAEFFGRLWNEANKLLDSINERIQNLPATRAPIPEIKERIKDLREKIPQLDPEEKEAIKERLDEMGRDAERSGKRWLKDAYERLKKGLETHHWSDYEGR